jgi:hypothetical protein
MSLSKQYSKDIYIALIRERYGVAGEMRFFNCLELGLNISQHLNATTDDSVVTGEAVNIQRVSYEVSAGIQHDENKV